MLKSLLQATSEDTSTYCLNVWLKCINCAAYKLSGQVVRRPVLCLHATHKHKITDCSCDTTHFTISFSLTKLHCNGSQETNNLVSKSSVWSTIRPSLCKHTLQHGSHCATEISLCFAM